MDQTILKQEQKTLDVGARTEAKNFICVELEPGCNLNFEFQVSPTALLSTLDEISMIKKENITVDLTTQR